MPPQPPGLSHIEGGGGEYTNQSVRAVQSSRSEYEAGS